MKTKHLFLIFVFTLLVIASCRQEAPKPTLDTSTPQKKPTTVPLDTTLQDTTQDKNQAPQTQNQIQPPPAPHITTLTIKGDDYSLDPAAVQVRKGDIVKITFVVSKNNVYYGGLDFRSDKQGYFNTGKILPGESKEVTFSADESFSYKSYWPSSGVVKATGQVNVVS